MWLSRTFIREELSINHRRELVDRYSSYTVDKRPGGRPSDDRVSRSADLGDVEEKGFDEDGGDVVDGGGSGLRGDMMH